MEEESLPDVKAMLTTLLEVGCDENVLHGNAEGLKWSESRNTTLIDMDIDPAATNTSGKMIVKCAKIREMTKGGVSTCPAAVLACWSKSLAMVNLSDLCTLLSNRAAAWIELGEYAGAARDSEVVFFLTLSTAKPTTASPRPWRSWVWRTSAGTCAPSGIKKGRPIQHSERRRRLCGEREAVQGPVPPRLPPANGSRLCCCASITHSLIHSQIENIFLKELQPLLKEKEFQRTPWLN